jgi:superoxide reductase
LRFGQERLGGVVKYYTGQATAMAGRVCKMTKNRLEVYKCEVCGNVVTVLHVGGGTLVCCGQPMQLLVENTVDASAEKHVPMIEPVSGGVRVAVGRVPHPMEEKHHIEWIEVVAGGRSYRQFLKPGDPPEAVFPLSETDGLLAREFCNLHLLWKA